MSGDAEIQVIADGLILGSQMAMSSLSHREPCPPISICVECFDMVGA